MAMLTDQQVAKERRKMAAGLARYIHLQLRAMRARAARPRTHRLAKQARALKSLIAEAHAAGVVSPRDTARSTPAKRGNRHYQIETRNFPPPVR